MAAGLSEGRRSEAIICLTLSGRRNDMGICPRKFVRSGVFELDGSPCCVPGCITCTQFAHRVRNFGQVAWELQAVGEHLGCMQACWPQTPLIKCSGSRSHKICWSPCFHAFRPVIPWPNPPWARPRSIQGSLQICKLSKQQLCSQVRSKYGLVSKKQL